MRTTLVLSLVASTSLLACNGPEKDIGPPPEAPVNWHAFETARNVQAPVAGPTPRERALAEGYLAALASPGFAALSPLLDGDAHFSFPGTPGARGREAILKAHDGLLGALDDRVATATRVWRTDDEQTVEWTMTGVVNRDFMGVPATHKPVTFKGVSLLWTKDDGTLTDVHVMFDVAVVKALCGGGPKELAGVVAPPAASGAPQVFEQTKTAEEAANVTVVRTWLDALERNDEAGYLAAFAPDAAVETVSARNPLHGKDELKAYFKGVRKAIGQLDTAIDGAFGVGKYAIVDYTIAGELMGPYGWVPAQRDKVVRLHVVDVVELAGGKIAHVWRYDDPGEIAASGP